MSESQHRSETSRGYEYRRWRGRPIASRRSGQSTDLAEATIQNLREGDSGPAKRVFSVPKLSERTAERPDPARKIVVFWRKRDTLHGLDSPPPR
jgi:hypothetical protein